MQELDYLYGYHFYFILGQNNIVKATRFSCALYNTCLQSIANKLFDRETSQPLLYLVQNYLGTTVQVTRRKHSYTLRHRGLFYKIKIKVYMHGHHI